jgi:hypothetical protein
MKTPDDVWRTAVLMETGRKLQMSCTKWVFCFRPHADGGYEYLPRNSAPIRLDSESSVLIGDLLRQYREVKGNC